MEKKEKKRESYMWNTMTPLLWTTAQCYTLNTIIRWSQIMLQTLSNNIETYQAISTITKNIHMN